MIIDTSMPQDQFTVATSGSFVEQNGTGSMGTAELGTDGEGTQFLHFDEDFSTSLATDTVTVYLSTSSGVQGRPGEWQS